MLMLGRPADAAPALSSWCWSQAAGVPVAAARFFFLFRWCCVPREADLLAVYTNAGGFYYVMGRKEMSNPSDTAHDVLA